MRGAGRGEATGRDGAAPYLHLGKEQEGVKGQRNKVSEKQGLPFGVLGGSVQGRHQHRRPWGKHWLVVRRLPGELSLFPTLSLFILPGTFTFLYQSVSPELLNLQNLCNPTC